MDGINDHILQRRRSHLCIKTIHLREKECVLDLTCCWCTESCMESLSVSRVERCIVCKLEAAEEPCERPVAHAGRE